MLRDVAIVRERFVQQRDFPGTPNCPVITCFYEERERERAVLSDARRQWSYKIQRFQS